MSCRSFWTIGFGLALALGTVPSARAQFRQPVEPAPAETPADANSQTEAPKDDAAKGEAAKEDAPKSEAPKSEAPKGEATKGEATKGEATKGATAPDQNATRSPFSDPAQQKRMLRAMVTGQGSMGFGGRNSGGLTSLVLRSKALQEELKVTDEQKKQIEEINKQSDDRRNEMMRQMRDGREEGQRPDFNSIRDNFRNMGQEQQEAALRVLTTEQKQRLNQIALQIEGPTALAKVEIGRQVNLSPSQQQQVQAIVNQFTATLEQSRQQQFGAMFGGRGGPGGQQGGPGGQQGGPGGQQGGRGFAQGGPGGFGPGSQQGGPGGFGPGGQQGGPGGFGPGGQQGGPGGFGPGGQQGGPGGRGFAQGGPGGQQGGPGGRGFAQGGPGGFGPGGQQGGPGGATQTTDRRQMFAQMQERAKKQAEDEDKLLEQTEARIAKVLTVKQRKSFNALLGETFDLAKLFEGGMNALFGGGRGGPGGGGPGGGGPGGGGPGGGGRGGRG